MNIKSILLSVLFMPFILHAQLDMLIIDGVAKIGNQNGIPTVWTPTLSVFGDHVAGNFAMYIRQGDEGADKGITFESPNSGSSARIFMENNKFFMGRGSSGNNKILTIDNLGNLGVGQVSPSSKLHVNGGVQIEGVAKIGNQNGIPTVWTPTLSVFGDHVAGNFAMYIRQGDEGADKGITFESPNSGSSARIFMENNKFFIGRGSSGSNRVLTFDNLGNIGMGQVSPRSKLHVSGGDVYIDDHTRGVIMSSPDGNCWRIVINNAGTLSATSVVCP